MDLKEARQSLKNLEEDIQTLIDRQGLINTQINEYVSKIWQEALVNAEGHEFLKTLDWDVNSGGRRSGRVVVRSPFKDAKFLDGKTWGVDDSALGNYGEGVPCEGPYPFKLILDLVESFKTEHPDVYVDLDGLKSHVPCEDMDSVANFRDICDLHPADEVHFLLKGEVFPPKWDIGEPYVEVLINGEVWAWWSSRTYGSLLNRCAKRGTPEFEEYSAFRGSGVE